MESFSPVLEEESTGKTPERRRVSLETDELVSDPSDLSTDDLLGRRRSSNISKNDLPRNFDPSTGKEVRHPQTPSTDPFPPFPIRPNDFEASTSTQNPKPNTNTSYPNPKLKGVAPFPSRLTKKPKESIEPDILEVFRRVQLNIPLLDAIKQVPRYAKFFKDLCTHKRKLKGNEVITLSENVSAVLQHKLPPKCKDKGSFSIPITIGKTQIPKAMCDLGLPSVSCHILFIYL